MYTAIVKSTGEKCTHPATFGTFCGYHQNDFDPNHIYKVIPNTYLKPEGLSLLPRDQQSGFIHATFGTQVRNIIERFFADVSPSCDFANIDSVILHSHGIEVLIESNKPGGKPIFICTGLFDS